MLKVSQKVDYKYQLKYLVISTVICVLLIISYGTYRCRNTNFKDPLTNSIAGDSGLNKYLDGWGILHFWFYAMLMYKCPNLWGLIIIFGIIWEIVEMRFEDKPFYLMECDVNLSDDGVGWWYGRWQDIVMNSLGMITGALLLKYGVKQSVFGISLFIIVFFHTVY